MFSMGTAHARRAHFPLFQIYRRILRTAGNRERLHQLAALVLEQVDWFFHGWLYWKPEAKEFVDPNISAPDAPGDGFRRLEVPLRVYQVNREKSTTPLLKVIPYPES